jgi:hypothetical protein
MHPKGKAAAGAPAAPRFKQEKFHYMEAYRPRIQAVHPDWTTGQYANTLTWMWKYMATDHDRAEASRIFNANSRELLATDDRRIPTVIKTAGDPAPPPAPVPVAVAGEEGDEEEEEEGRGPEPGEGPVEERETRNEADHEQVGAAAFEPHNEPNPSDAELEDNNKLDRNAAGPKPKNEPRPAVNNEDDNDNNARAAAAPTDNAIASEVNTTIFSFWPDVSAVSTTLPRLRKPVSQFKKDGKKRKLFKAGIDYESDEESNKRWQGAHVLGAGTSGLASLWVQTDEGNNILQVRIRSRIHVATSN